MNNGNYVYIKVAYTFGQIFEKNNEAVLHIFCTNN